ncbi:MAG TPA: capsule biosynthesis protein [Methylobacterium sp.]|jgi:capsular polysaccharide transport system permease protein
MGMNVDEVKHGDRLRGVIDLARRSLPDVRRNAETIEPVTGRQAPAIWQKVRERLDWTRLPGIRPQSTKPKNLVAVLLKRFGLFVMLPTALAGLYLFAFASDQYVAEARFAVRGNVEPMGDVNLGEFTSLIHKHNSQDSFVVKEYIESQTMVDEIEKAIGVTRMFSRPEADFWARWDTDKPIEDLTKYWRRHVSARIDVVSGIITLSVRAFTREDALTIAKEVVTRAEALINRISRRAQADMMVHAQEETVKAQKRLREAHLGLQTFRNNWGIIDPLKAAESTSMTMATLRRDKLKAESDLQVLRGSSLDEKSRSIQVLVANIAALEHQIKELKDQLTTEGLAAGSGTNMTQALLEYEGLQVERTIAEKLNESANLLLDKARIAASKQHIYLAAFVPPVLPEDSLYPRRYQSLAVFFLCILAVWSSASLVVAGINDQRL